MKDFSALCIVMLRAELGLPLHPETRNTSVSNRCIKKSEIGFSLIGAASVWSRVSMSGSACPPVCYEGRECCSSYMCTMFCRSEKAIVHRKTRSSPQAIFDLRNSASMFRVSLFV